MATLSPTELRKYDWRTTVFVDKLTNNKPFRLVDGGVVTLSYSPEVVECIQKGDLKDLRALRIDGYKLTDLVKCEDFGGKNDNGTKKEQFALSNLNKQILDARGNSSHITVRFRENIFQVSQAENTPGTPKSDFHLVNPDNEEVFWISHKDGKSAKCFQQWGGVSLKSEPLVNQHDEVQSFVADLKAKVPDGVPRAMTFARKISCDTLKNMSVYGNQYGNSFSRQNVNVAIQGSVDLIFDGSEYIIGGSIIHENGEALTGSYEPTLIATFRGDRSNEGLPCTRISIAPLEGRKITEWI